MATDSVHGSSPNGDHENERLAKFIARLQDECAKLRQSLAEMTEERDFYLRAVYAYSRGEQHFRDVDIPDLQAMSAGPVEFLS